MTIVPAAGWEQILERIAAGQGTVMFLGRSDSGKSTLVRYLLQQLSSLMPVSLVDADVGQSWLGLPGTVSRRTFHAPPSRRELRWEELSFLGAVSPVRIISLLAAETGRFVQRGRKDAAVTLVDTTGLVEGSLGRALKLAKLRAVEPDLVVAVTAGDELEPVLSALPKGKVLRVPPSPLVKRRSAALRYRYRHARLARHLHGARELFLASRRLLFVHHGLPVHTAFAPPEPGIMVGLNRGTQTRALGVIVEAEAESLLVLTPLLSARGIDRVVLGDFSFRQERSAEDEKEGDEKEYSDALGT
jgi:polynucleotide 5'-hydroxyl-kinase GRC3/NOL9